MRFNLTLLSLAAAAGAAFATPVAWQEGATCKLVLVPQTAVTTETELVSEFNIAIGRTLSTAVEGEIDNAGAKYRVKYDGSYEVHDKVSADGRTSAETGALIEGWVDTVIEGWTINWLVRSAVCHASRH